MRRFELKHETPARFWIIALEENTITVGSGTIMLSNDARLINEVVRRYVDLDALAAIKPEGQ
jgi:hypothetical protein